MKPQGDAKHPLILTRIAPPSSRTRRDIEMCRKSALYGSRTSDRCDSDDIEERTSWAYLGKKTEAQLRQRLLVETDPFILGELVERSVGTNWLDDDTYSHIRTVGGRALMHAAITNDADESTVDAFVNLVLACEDPAEYKHICRPLTAEWVTCHFVAAHPRTLPAVLAHTVRHGLVNDTKMERSSCWLTGRPHLLHKDHITTARALLTGLTTQQDTVAARLWRSMALASPTVTDWKTVADVNVHTLKALGTPPPTGPDLYSTIFHRLWDHFHGTVGELLATVDAFAEPS